ncbi:hypothetical protein POKO110462_10590 [Pontibacter korlensis]
MIEALTQIIVIYQSGQAWNRLIAAVFSIAWQAPVLGDASFWLAPNYTLTT